jgi:aspartate/methionine/tyrosine aminotransferase
MSAIRLAGRTANIAPFQVMELVKRAMLREQQGRPVIHLSIGEPDFTAPEPVLAALERAARSGHTQYTPALGTAALRGAIAADYRSRHGVEVDPARVVVTAGASAALSLACCALVDPGDEVLLTDPSYPCNRHFVAAFDGVPRPVPVFADTRFQMTEALLGAHWGPKTRGALLASPANPTGTSIPFDELGRIVKAGRAREGFTIVDEIYLGLSYGEGRLRSALELGDDVIVTNSFSKYFSMTGWRLGWMLVPPALAPTFEKLAQNLYICASALAQHAALGCFEPAAAAVFEQRRERCSRVDGPLEVRGDDRRAGMTDRERGRGEGHLAQSPLGELGATLALQATLDVPCGLPMTDDHETPKRRWPGAHAWPAACAARSTRWSTAPVAGSRRGTSAQSRSRA